MPHRLLTSWRRGAVLALVVGLPGCGENGSPTPADLETEPTASLAHDGGGAGKDEIEAGISFDQCAAVAVEANEVPANILFVLDSSGSMNCIPPDGDEAEATLCRTDPRKRGDGPSKWQVTYESLTSALGPLTGRSNLNVAISSFPLLGTRCDVAVAPAISFDSLDEDLLDDSRLFLEGISPEGETPIAGATILGYAAMANGLRNGVIRGNAYVVLLTDGEETCKPEELPKLIEKDAPAAREGFGIRTFVIGAPGSEGARLLLSRLAHAGGTDAYSGCNYDDDGESPDCHFDMTTTLDFQADLSRALDEITRTKALRCEFELPHNPDGGGVDLAKVNVTLVENVDAGPHRTPIGRHEGPSGSCEGKDDGWTYAADKKHILVCGSDCETVTASTEAQVQIVLGCPTLDRGDIR